MKTKIKEVQDYFKAKLLNGSFDVKSQSEHLITVLIDEEYKFLIWVGNILNIPTGVKLYEYTSSFMDIPFTDEESLILSGIISPIVIKYKKEDLLKKKTEELKRLKEEIDGLQR